MMQHPLNRAYKANAAISAPASPSNPAITIARQAAEIDRLRGVIADIDSQVRDLNMHKPRTGAYMLAVLAIRRILMEWRV